MHPFAMKPLTRRALARSATTLLAAVALALALAPAQAFFFRTPQWPEIKQSIHEGHPGMPQTTTAQLRLWLADASRAPPLLLDSRAPAEYEVSHLQGARLAPSLSAALRVLEGRAKDAPVVVYCSVGVRSAALVQQLMREGWLNVSNLDGSIFEWANQGYPVFRGDAPAILVHPYSKSWGTLLNRRYWAESAL